MPAAIRLAALLAALGLPPLLGAATPAFAQAPPCPSDFGGQSAPITCACTAAAAAAQGAAVWGSGPYTSDSRICRAALHAGAIPAAGGTVTVSPAPGQQSYAASSANGVQTSSYGPWSGSFTVAAAGGGGGSGKPPPLGQETTAAGPACPANFESQSAPLACACTAEATEAGTVWGTGAYTSDSSICRAARHAGIIPAQGGQLELGAPRFAHVDIHRVRHSGLPLCAQVLRRSG